MAVFQSIALLVLAARAGGVRAGPRAALRARRAVSSIDEGDPVEHYLALRGAVCRGPVDHGAFDAAYVAAFAGRPGAARTTGAA